MYPKPGDPPASCYASAEHAPTFLTRYLAVPDDQYTLLVCRGSTGPLGPFIERLQFTIQVLETGKPTTRRYLPISVFVTAQILSTCRKIRQEPVDLVDKYDIGLL